MKRNRVIFAFILMSVSGCMLDHRNDLQNILESYQANIISRYPQSKVLSTSYGRNIAVQNSTISLNNDIIKINLIVTWLKRPQHLQNKIDAINRLKGRSKNISEAQNCMENPVVNTGVLDIICLKKNVEYNIIILAEPDFFINNQRTIYRFIDDSSKFIEANIR